MATTVLDKINLTLDDTSAALAQLPSTVGDGDVGHNDDHEYIKQLLDDLPDIDLALSRILEMMPVSATAYGATGLGVVDESDALRDALAAGDVLFIPAGVYKIMTKGLAVVDRDHVRIIGAGMGLTVLDASDHVGELDNSGLGLNPLYDSNQNGVVFATSTTLTALAGFYLADMTIMGQQGVAPTIGAAAVAGTTAFDVMIGHVDDSTVERVQFFGNNQNHECVMHQPHGASGNVRSTNYRVIDCVFENTGYGEQVTLNGSTKTTHAYITGNFFRGCPWIAIHCNSDHYVISGNIFYRCGANAIRAGEGTPEPSVGNCVISGNVVSEQGYGVTGALDIIAIYVVGKANTYTDDPGGVEPRLGGVIVANNVVRDMHCVASVTAASRPVRAFQFVGNVTATGNVAAGVLDSTYAQSAAFYISFGGNATEPNTTHVYMQGNVVEQTPNTTKWSYGIAIQAHANGDRLSVFCAMNRVFDIDPAAGFALLVGNAATHANVHFCGDILVGQVVLRKGTLSAVTVTGANEPWFGSNIGTRVRFIDGFFLGNNVIWTSGAGTPEGNLAAPMGSLYTRTDGGVSTTLYVKTSGSGNTGWTAK